jgi:hypothetical protein
MDISHVTWRKATYSGGNGGGCVEVAAIPAAIAVRDSKDPDGHKLTFTLPVWQSFIQQVRNTTLGTG